MRVALDTNVLAYAEGVNGPAMKESATDLVRRLPAGSAVLPVQTLGELFNVLVRKAGRSPANAQTAILTWMDAFPVVDTLPRSHHRSRGLGRNRSPARNLGCRDPRRLGSGRLQIAAFGRSAGWLHLEWAYRNEPFLVVAARAARGVA